MSTYNACHLRVRYRRGPARDHSCADCGGQARHWSLIDGRDGESPEDYRPLCVSCHYRYDGVGNRPGERNSTARLTNAQVLAIWARRAEGQAALGREFGVAPQTINAIIHGWRWNTITGAKRPDSHARKDASA